MSDTVPNPLPPGGVRTNLWLESRYRKLRRGLPQTIFYCPKCRGDRRRRHGCEACGGFGKLTRESVQELIGRRLLPTMQAKEGRFHGAGREDIDVLMLGHGRPFIYEVVGARNPDIDLEALRLEIVARSEGAIELQPFVRVSKQRVAYWKETHFDKVYLAEVTIEGELAPERLAAVREFGGKIVQRTPQRVAHRRADLDRERSLRVLGLDLRADGTLLLRVVCQHGTYVKEWISGDEGRTEPSLSSLLGVACQCAVLDVEEILTDDIDGPRLPKESAPASESAES